MMTQNAVAVEKLLSMYVRFNPSRRTRPGAPSAISIYTSRRARLRGVSASVRVSASKSRYSGESSSVGMLAHGGT